ncbi:MAG: hypothetical protein IID44_27780 [Planctomycetes bacterium]|nr:hypothetical protein [Planctomycetota bacterium]
MTLRLFQSRAWTLAVLLVALSASAAALGDEITSYVPSPDDPPLYRQAPFDLVTLDKRNSGLVLKVYPLKVVGRDGNAARPKTGIVDVHLYSRPGVNLVLDLGQVVKIQFYEQMLLEQAKTLARAGQLDEAAQYLTAVRKKYPTVKSLDVTIQVFLDLDANDAREKQRYDVELTILQELHHLNANFPGLDEKMGTAIGRLIEQRVDEENYVAARGHMRQLEELFPGKSLEEVALRKKQFSDEAAVLRREADESFESGDFSRARRLAGRALVIWPDKPAQDLIEKIHARYPRVVVGVTSYYNGRQHNRFNSTAARRASRLMHRRLLELRSYGNEGGKYDSPFGEFTRNPEGTVLSFKITPGIAWADGRRTMTGHDVARRLLAMADPDRAGYRADWARLFAGVSVSGVYQVDVRLNRPHVRPDGYLDVIIDDGVIAPEQGGSGGGLAPVAGPYQPIEIEDGETRFVANAKFFREGKQHVREIVERYYRDPGKAALALRRGEISVLDRVSPADLDMLRSAGNITLETYRAPVVHCLVPNLRKPFMANRKFRRALVYGIDRAKILHEELYGSVRNKRAEQPGRVLSGPFPIGQPRIDSLGYAYDDSVKPRKYEPRLAMILAEVALQEVTKTEKDVGVEVKGIPKLVIGYPPLPTARAACQSIRQQLRGIGIDVTLHELRPGDPMQMVDKFDLLYVELAMWEPVVDARRLLGDDGLVGGGSPYLSMALRKLDKTIDWKDTRDELHAIHRIAHSDVTVIPLWQIYPTLAYRNTLKGVSKRPLLLYENVEKWQIDLDIPKE